MLCAITAVRKKSLAYCFRDLRASSHHRTRHPTLRAKPRSRPSPEACSLDSKPYKSHKPEAYVSLNPRPYIQKPLTSQTGLGCVVPSEQLLEVRVENNNLTAISAFLGLGLRQFELLAARVGFSRNHAGRGTCQKGDEAAGN